jgi:CubicO group peptidase (beta-lactamase class C family)
VLLNAAFGQARPGVPMTPDSLNLWLSAVKPIAAVAIAQLWERGLIELDDLVTRHIPEFARKGKDAITIRHILTHTAGFRAPPRSQEKPWDNLIAEMCAARQEPGWIPGKTAGYHLASSWYILGELVRRIDGRDYSRYVRGIQRLRQSHGVDGGYDPAAAGAAGCRSDRHLLPAGQRRMGTDQGAGEVL